MYDILDKNSYICYHELEKGVVPIGRNLKIKAARAEKDMTQKALAEAVGISRQTLTPIRNGHKEATVETAEQIRNALGLTNEEYSQIFPWQSEITAVKERYNNGQA